MRAGRHKVKRQRAPRAPAERPSQILDAAARVLLRDGPRRTTIDGIAAEAGLGKGTVYEYYGSKAELFAALRAHHTEQTLAAGHEAVAASPPARGLERVQRFVAGMSTYGMANSRLVSVLFHETGRDDTDDLAPIRQALGELVGDGVDAGQLTVVGDIDFTVGFLLHGLHGVMEDVLHHGQDGERVREHMQVVIAALLDPGGRLDRPPGDLRNRRETVQ